MNGQESILVLRQAHFELGFGNQEGVGDTTVDGRNIQTPSIRYNPLAPKVQCYCNLKCVSPNGRKKSNP